jgi:hypothetical protein
LFLSGARARRELSLSLSNVEPRQGRQIAPDNKEDLPIVQVIPEDEVIAEETQVVDPADLALVVEVPQDNDIQRNPLRPPTHNSD